MYLRIVVDRGRCLFKAIGKERKLEVDLVRLAAHRSEGVAPVGMLIADSMRGWHDPEAVNGMFRAFGSGTDLFSRDDCERLAVLWQFRHSIVHTGGTLTQPDAQKVEAIKSLGDG